MFKHIKLKAMLTKNSRVDKVLNPSLEVIALAKNEKASASVMNDLKKKIFSKCEKI